jgi:hypothetical protein
VGTTVTFVNGIEMVMPFISQTLLVSKNQFYEIFAKLKNSLAFNDSFIGGTSSNAMKK